MSYYVFKLLMALFVTMGLKAAPPENPYATEAELTNLRKSAQVRVDQASMVPPFFREGQLRSVSGLNVLNHAANHDQVDELCCNPWRAIQNCLAFLNPINCYNSGTVWCCICHYCGCCETCSSDNNSGY